MRISIAMCTYNGAQHLEEQLDSFMAQERLPDELVVCDDGSHDSSVSLLQHFAEKAPFGVRLIRNDVNLGYSRNFAQALATCSGDLIALSDQDDRWHARKLTVLEQVMLKDGRAEGVFSDGDIVDESSRPTHRTLWEAFGFGPNAQASFREGRALEELLRRNVVTGMTLMVRNSAQHLLQEMPGSWVHDGWLAFQIALRSRLIACPERLVSYRVHTGQQLGVPPSNSMKLRDAWQQGLRKYSESFLTSSAQEYEQSARQFADLLAYLEQNGLATADLRARVRAKQRHGARGAALLARGRLMRIVPILANLRSYARFSPNGFRAVLRDLLI